MASDDLICPLRRAIVGIETGDQVESLDGLHC